MYARLSKHQPRFGVFDSKQRKFDINYGDAHLEKNET